MIDHRLDRINLSKGGHTDAEAGICVMEAASMLAGEKFSDHPECVSNVIGDLLRTWNDALDDDDRQMLRPYALRVLGTDASEEIERQRLYLALDWLVCICIPMWLRFISLTDHAEVLESLAPIQTAGDAGIAINYLNRAEAAAYAVVDAARTARAADAAAADAYTAGAVAAAAAAAAADAYTAALYAADAAGGAAAAAEAAADARVAAYAAADAVARTARAVRIATAYAVDDADAAAGDAARVAAAYTDAARVAAPYTDACGRDFFDALQQSAFDLLDRMIALKHG